MPDFAKYSAAPIPRAEESSDATAYLKAIFDVIDPKMVHTATSAADRDARLGDLPAGAVVTCPALSTIWMRTSTGWKVLFIDQTVTSFTYPDTKWAAGAAGTSWVRNINGTIHVNGTSVLTADITSFSNGNLTDTTLATIPVNWRPTQLTPGSCVLAFLGATAYLQTDGQVRLLAWQVTSATVVTGSAALYYFTYPAP